MFKGNKVALLTLFAVIYSFFMAGYASGEISTRITWDFETGNLYGWTKSGTAFNFQPTYGDNPTARRRGQPSNHQGQYWIGGFEKYQGLPGQRPGETQ